MAYDSNCGAGCGIRLPVVGATLLALIVGSVSAHAGTVSRIAVTGDAVELAFEGQIDRVISRTLANPPRIAIDVEGSTAGVRGTANGAVAAVRVAQFAPSTTRIVLDLSQPETVGEVQFAPDGASVAISLVPVRSALTSPHIAAPMMPGADTATDSGFIRPPAAKKYWSQPIAKAGASLPRPHIYGPAGRPLVVIDAGHGGQDPGAINPATGQREKDVTLATAKHIRDTLLASGRVRVALTREDDHFIVLRERSAIAHALGADLFISIHADSEPGSDAHGATIYTLSETASDKEAQALAARENKADIIHGVNLSGENADVTSILLDLAQRETMNRSSAFASLLKRESVGQIPFRSDYHRTAGFAVLKQPDMPSCLLEIGYISNPGDVSRIASSDGQSRIASGVAKAVEIHFARQMAAN